LSAEALAVLAGGSQRARSKLARARRKLIDVADLHLSPPMTMAQAHSRRAWILPSVALAFTLLALGAALDLLVWDRPITEAAIGARTGWLNGLAGAVSRFGSTPVVLTVAALAAAAAWPRCRRLSLAIVVVALARPLVEFGFKELIDRPRPASDQLVRGRGPSFPSGHPFATAASWGLVPLVVALYTQRRTVWWTVAAAVWALAVAVAASRVWLGVHWTSDVVAGLLLAVLGVAASERFINFVHRGSCCGGTPALSEPVSVTEGAVS
jgi:undecaprenyl-diphosphatase